jgi:hypothetical protein
MHYEMTDSFFCIGLGLQGIADIEEPILMIGASHANHLPTVS